MTEDAAERFSSGFAEVVQEAVQEVMHEMAREVLLRGIIIVTLRPMSENRARVVIVVGVLVMMECHEEGGRGMFVCSADSPAITRVCLSSQLSFHEPKLFCRETHFFWVHISFAVRKAAAVSITCQAEGREPISIL